MPDKAFCTGGPKIKFKVQFKAEAYSRERGKSSKGGIVQNRMFDTNTPSA